MSFITNSLRRLTGLIDVVERDGVIEVKGVPADTIYNDISRLWSTSKINGNLFITHSKSGLKFPSFFAVEVAYMLEQLLLNVRSYTRRQPIERILVLLRERTWLAATVGEVGPFIDFKQLSRIGRRGKPHQIQFLETYNDLCQRYRLGGYILAAAPGSGKTMACLMLGVCLKVNHHVIVSPKNAVYEVWKREILDWVKGATVWVESEGLPYQGEEYLVCHYEALGKMVEVCKGLVGKRIAVTLDESHNLNELSSLRTQLFVGLCQLLKPVSVVWSSGTPLKALGGEAVPILRTIDPMFTADVEERFRRIFGKQASRGLDILKHRLGLVSFKVTKDQFTERKPTSMDIKVSIANGRDYTVEAVKEQMRQFIVARMDFYQPQLKSMEAYHYQCLDMVKGKLRSKSELAAHALYLDYLRQIKAGFDPYTMSHMSKFCNEYELKTVVPLLPDKVARDRFKEARSAVKYLKLKVLGEALGSCLGKARVNCHLDMVAQVDFKTLIDNSESKSVIFTSYVEVLERIRHRLVQAGFEPIVVYGKTNKDLDAMLEQFKVDPNANPVLATYKSLSTAVPLVSASTTVFFDSPFRDYILTQAKSRTDRIGQTKPVTFYNTVLDTGVEPNISTRSSDILAWSKDQIAQIMGEEGSAVHVETVDKYYEGFESFHDGSGVGMYDPSIVTMESLLVEFFGTEVR